MCLTKKKNIMKNPEKLIGKKVRGFKFETTKYCSYVKGMDKYVGKTGIIDKIVEDEFRVDFENDYFFYPADKIEAHLVEDEKFTFNANHNKMKLVDEIPTFTKEDLRTAYKIGFDIGIFNKKISSDKSFEEWFDKKTKEDQLIAILGNDEKVKEIMELFKN